MKKLFLGNIFVLIVLFANAQNDAKAVAILDKLSKKMETIHTIYAEFNFNLENLQDKISDKRAGHIWTKGNKYKITMMHSETYFDGKTIWTYLKESNEVTINTPDEEDDETINPATIFTIYKKGFKIKFVQDRFEMGHALYVIDLIPEKRDKPYSRIRLRIDKDKNQLFMFERFDKDGNNYKITLNKVIFNKPMKDTDFVFNVKAHKGIEVTDLRDD
jgi:outer membrane lipoprotein-sorting protein